jgi:hypothetical protein
MLASSRVSSLSSRMLSKGASYSQNQEMLFGCGFSSPYNSSSSSRSMTALS